MNFFKKNYVENTLNNGYYILYILSPCREKEAKSADEEEEEESRLLEQMVTTSHQVTKITFRKLFKVSKRTKCLSKKIHPARQVIFFFFAGQLDTVSVEVV
jgi:hypothetical protein